MPRDQRVIEQAARRLYDQQQKSGSTVTYERCRERMSGAVAQGDRKRAEDPTPSNK